MNLNKDISTPIAILIIVVAATLAGGIFYWQYQKVEEIEVLEVKKQSKGENLISNWQTYANEKYNFQIKYPQNWYYNTDDYGTMLLVCFNPEEVSEDCTALLTVKRHTTLQEEYTDKKLTWRLEKGYSFTESTISVGDIKGRLLKVDNPVDVSKSLFYEKEGYVFSFDILAREESIFNHMLSSFRINKSEKVAKKKDTDKINEPFQEIPIAYSINFHNETFSSCSTKIPNKIKNEMQRRKEKAVAKIVNEVCDINLDEKSATKEYLLYSIGSSRNPPIYLYRTVDDLTERILKQPGTILDIEEQKVEGMSNLMISGWLGAGDLYTCRFKWSTSKNAYVEVQDWERSIWDPQELREDIKKKKLGEPKDAESYTTQSTCEDFGYYWYGQACHEEQSETADWETYTNKAHGFRFKYPEDFSISSNSFATDASNAESISIYNFPEFKTEEREQDRRMDIETRKITELSEDKSIVDFNDYLEEVIKELNRDRISNYQESTFAGKNAVEFEVSESYKTPIGGFVLPQGTAEFTIVEMEDSRVLRIIKPPGAPLFEQILSSFEFID